MRNLWLILTTGLGLTLTVLAQTPPAPAGGTSAQPAAASAQPAAANPAAPQTKTEPAAPSPGQDVEKVLRAVKSGLVGGWQRVTQAVDAFLKPPPAPPVTERSSAPPPAPTAPAPAQPPPAPAQAVQTTPPAPPQSVPTPPAPQPAPAVAQSLVPAQPPAPAVPAPLAQPAPTPAAALTTTPAPAPQPPPATPAPPPAPPATAAAPQPPPQPVAQSPAQPPASPFATFTGTQILIHPIKTGTGGVKLLMVRSSWPTPPPLAGAETLKAPVRVEVQRITRKKDAADATPIAWSPGYSQYREAASLRISLRNLSPRSLTNVVVHWAIAKIPVGRNPMFKEVYLGTNETVALKPTEQKTIETTPVEVGGTKSTLIGRSAGEMIRGHGVQVMIGTNLIFEEVVPPNTRIPFKNLQPVPKPQ